MHFSREFESVHRLSLHAVERLATGQKQHSQGIACEGRKGKIAIGLGSEQRASHPINSVA